MPTHHWRETEPDGQRRQFQCRFFSGRWAFSVRERQREDWQPLDDLRRRHWDALRETMFNKYQRHRIPYEHLVELDQLIAQLPTDPDAPAPHPEARRHEDEARERKGRKRRRRRHADPRPEQADSLTPAGSLTPSPASADQPASWGQRDQAVLWHPFTAMAGWTDPTHEPLVLDQARGCFLWDLEGRRYFDGNATIWTNIHGHAEPSILRAVTDQLHQLDHASFLGTTHPKAIELAERLLSWANGSGTTPAPEPVPAWDAGRAAADPDYPQNAPLARVFYSDNGSTALEVALRLAIQVRQAVGQNERRSFIAFDSAYHGDTVGAASVSGVSRFFERFRNWHFPCERVRSFEALRSLPPELIEETTAVVIEPGIQGVNEMRPWPRGMLRELRAWCDEQGLLLILDEVLTGFGRSGSMFACQEEDVRADFLCLAKGITGGTIPLAATLVTAEIYESLLDPADTFHYGHSYTANPPACAAALASLDLFEGEQFFPKIRRKIDLLAALFTALRARCQFVHEVRQFGFIAGIELRQANGEAFEAEDEVGVRVCLVARNQGLLTRPIRNTIVFLPALSVGEEELREALEGLRTAIETVCA